MFLVSYPRGDIFRLAGSDESVELFCHLDPAHSYFKKVSFANIFAMSSDTTQRDCKLKLHKLLVSAKSAKYF